MALSHTHNASVDAGSTGYKRRQRQRSIAIALVLFAFVVMFYLVTMVRIGANLAQRAM